MKERQSMQERIAKRTVCAGLTVVLAVIVVTCGSLTAQTLTVLHAFTDNPDGKTPTGNVTMDAQGNLYGTTTKGGVYDGAGVVFKIDSSGNEQVIFDIGALGGPISPLAGPTVDSRGNLFGTTSTLFADNGSVWTVSRNGQGSYVYLFTGNQDGSNPMYSNLVLARPPSAVSRNVVGALDVFYGVTTGYPIAPCSQYFNICGTLFKLKQNGEFTLLHTFGTGTDGQTPFQGLVEDSQGNFYGTTACGGTYNGGTVFEWSAAGTYQVLYNFPLGGGGDQCVSGAVNGPWGSGSLQVDPDGNLYGATWHDGVYGWGNVFKLSPSGAGWTYSSLYDFTNGDDGGVVRGGLVRDAAGNLYGAASGGAMNQGTIFEIKNDGTFRTLYAFSGSTDGKTPGGGFILDGMGNLYGTTSGGGDPTCHCGTVFELSNIPGT